MGVPAFFRWLSKKYPSIVTEHQRGKTSDQHFDNLYLDMNGIIHPCTHPEDKAAPETEEEMFIAIQEYIEMVLKMLKPKKLLYMAVDGVAPRAKMNQQRSRRFRASQESQDKADHVKLIKDELRANGVDVDSFSKKDGPHFDSNVITPGTDFMLHLSASLRKWIDEKLSPDYDDPDGLWPKDMVVILSDASVPGEGEHKIMDYIRKQKAQATYDHNLSHCLLGADADLIMLGLATHEMNFTILREEFVPNQPRPCEICAQYGHIMAECTGEEAHPDEEIILPIAPGFIFIRLPVLREYLAKEAEGLDLERFIDDFVFLCFFVGNDFLPHLPSLEIREGAVDRLLNIYRDVLRSQQQKEYLTSNGIVDLRQVQRILNVLGQFEDEIFRQRKESDRRFRERLKRQKQHNGGQSSRNDGWSKPQALNTPQRTQNSDQLLSEARELRLAGNSQDRLEAMLRPSDSSSTGNQGKRKHGVNDADSDDEPDDNVQLGMPGWKERYYFRKFDCADVTNIASQVSREYVKGLCWVLLYYYQGCPDWQWFYPYHYAPFASDFRDIVRTDVTFNHQSKPFKPLEQLMSVFPAASSQNLPPSWRRLMSDSKSSIIDFYPSGFRIDMNGKKAAWMGVALLPFIDEQRLMLALKSVYKDLTEREIERNLHGPHLVFVSKSKSSSHSFLTSFVSSQEKEEQMIPDGCLDSISGSLRWSDKFSPEARNTFCIEFYDPVYDSEFVFPAAKHVDARTVPRALKPDDHVGQFRPTIGFPGSNNQRAFLPNSGQRMIQNAMGQSHSRFSSQTFVASTRHEAVYGQSADNGQQSWSRQPPRNY